jgi:hypothetical protein
LARVFPTPDIRRNLSQEVNDPATSRGLSDALSTADPEVGADSQGKHLLDDLPLGVDRDVGAGSTPAGILNREVKGG